MIDRLPAEICNKILSITRYDAEFSPMTHSGESYLYFGGHTWFARMLVVSKEWARIATPHLYHHLYLDLFRPTLRCLAASLLATPIDHPRRTWIRVITAHAEFEPNGDMYDCHDPVHISNVSNWLTVVFSHSTLKAIHMHNIPMHRSAMTSLMVTSNHTLTELSIVLDPRDVGVLRIIKQMSSLSYLSLDFDLGSQVEISTPMPISDLTVAPLHLPNICDFAWSWLGDPDNEFYDMPAIDGLRYLAQCQFSSTCQIHIGMSHITLDEMAVLNPFFLRHHSKQISLSCDIPENSSIFMHSSRVLFRSMAKPHPRLFDAQTLPSFIRFDSNIPSQMDHVFLVLDALAYSNYTHQTCIQIFARVSVPTNEMNLSKIPLPILFRWDQAPGTTTQEYEDVHVRLFAYARLLLPKGIILADGDMKIFKH